MDRAFEWGRKNGAVRVNEVHGEEEVRLVLTETFQLENTDLEEVNRTGSFEVEEGVIYAHVCTYTPCHIHSCPFRRCPAASSVTRIRRARFW